MMYDATEYEMLGWNKWKASDDWYEVMYAPVGHQDKPTHGTTLYGF